MRRAAIPGLVTLAVLRLGPLNLPTVRLVVTVRYTGAETPMAALRDA